MWKQLKISFIITGFVKQAALKEQISLIYKPADVMLSWNTYRILFPSIS